MDDVMRLEQVCREMYEPTDPARQKEAERQLIQLSQMPNALAMCQMLLDQSRYNYSQVIAFNTLAKIVSSNTGGSMKWTDRMEIRHYLLNYLYQRPNLPRFVIQAATRLFGVVVKVGWFDRNETSDFVMRDIQQFVSRFLQSTQIDLNLIGVELLTATVNEMNRLATELPSKSLSYHVRISSSFRDNNLYQVFKLSVDMLREALGNVKRRQQQQQQQTQQPNNNATAEYAQQQRNQYRLLGQLLKLSLACLNYDFIGTAPDDACDDATAIQVPTTWRPIFLDQTILQLFFDVYAWMPSSSSAENSSSNEAADRSHGLTCLIQLASVRRSIFANHERHKYLNQLVGGVASIIEENSESLSDAECYHEFCRLLSRLKSNYQLAELVEVDRYAEIIAEITRFTVLSLEQWKFASNSIHYLLSLWQRLVASMPYVKAAKPHLLDQYAPEVTLAYIAARIAGVEVVMRDGCEDPLDDVGMVQQQLDQFSTIARCDYQKTCNLLVHEFDKTANEYQQVLQQPVMSTTSVQIVVEEGKLTWLVYLIGAAVGGRVSYTGSAGAPLGGNGISVDDQDIADGQLICRVLSLLGVLENLAEKGRPVAERLELATLFFFENFRKIYITDSAPRSVCDILEKQLGLSDDNIILSVILRKIVSNLKLWSSNETVIGKTLSLFNELTLGYTSIRKLLKLPEVQFLLRNHSGEHFPFLGPNSTLDDQRPRTLFYQSMARMLIAEINDDDEEQFEAFVAPIDRTARQVVQEFSMLNRNQLAQYEQTAALKKAIIGLARDIRGIAIAFMSRATFLFLWSWLFRNKYTQMFMDALQLWSTDYRLCVPVLKMLGELSNNKSQRIQFEPSNPDGTLLFKEICQVFCRYCVALLQGLPADIVAPNATSNKQLSTTTGGAAERTTFPNDISSSSNNSPLLLLDSVILGNNSNHNADSNSPSLISNESRRKSISGSTATGGGGVAAAGSLAGGANNKQRGTLEIYKIKLKGLIAAINMLRNTLVGGYCCFGVFRLYGDNTLNDVYSVLVKVLNSISQQDILSFPKLRASYFSVIEALAQDHMQFIESIDQQTFLYILTTLTEGLCIVGTLTEGNFTSECANALDWIMSALFKEMLRLSKKDAAAASAAAGGVAGGAQQAALANGTSPTTSSLSPNGVAGGSNTAADASSAGGGGSVMRRVFQNSPQVYRHVLSSVMNCVFYEDSRSQWALSRPLLPLILLQPVFFQELEQRVVQAFTSVDESRRTQAVECFRQLMEGIENNLLPKNRDRFTQNLALARREFQDVLNGRLNSNVNTGHTAAMDAIRERLFNYLTLSLDPDSLILAFADED